MITQPGRCACVRLPVFRAQQHLPGQLAFCKLPLHLLVADALSRGMLIDEHDARIGLGEDIAVMKLGQRRTQIEAGLVGTFRFAGLRCGKQAVQR